MFFYSPKSRSRIFSARGVIFEIDVCNSRKSSSVWVKCCWTFPARLLSRSKSVNNKSSSRLIWEATRLIFMSDKTEDVIYKTKRKPTALWAVGDSLTGAGFKPSTCQDCEAIRFIWASSEADCELTCTRGAQGRIPAVAGRTPALASRSGKAPSYSIIIGNFVNFLWYKK